MNGRRVLYQRAVTQASRGKETLIQRSGQREFPASTSLLTSDVITSDV